MSQQLIAHSPDLKQLRDEGYDIALIGGFVLVRDVPYVDSNRTVKKGILISTLELSGDKTVKPITHVADWTGEHPCYADGTILDAIRNSPVHADIGNGIVANFRFSAKADYRDYYHKLTTYIAIITGEATKLDPAATAQTFPAIPEDTSGGVFKYVDTASSRVNINALNEKLAHQRIGIIGLGGTGAYVLDFVAKTWVAEIRLFDGDIFSQHNAFRSPGAVTLEQLRAALPKVEQHGQTYAHMRNGIVLHNVYISEDNLGLLDGLDFVFLCMDRGTEKRCIVDWLVAKGIPFIDTGIGIPPTDDQPLTGMVRSVISTPENRATAAQHISYADGNQGNDDYATNIQIAELNAMNAVLAVVQWKKYYGIYADANSPCYAGYSITSGEFAYEGAV